MAQLFSSKTKRLQEKVLRTNFINIKLKLLILQTEKKL